MKYWMRRKGRTGEGVMFVLIGRAVWECTVEYVRPGSNKTNWQGRMNGSINQGSSDSVRQVKKNTLYCTCLNRL